MIWNKWTRGGRSTAQSGLSGSRCRSMGGRRFPTRDIWRSVQPTAENAVDTLRRLLTMKPWTTRRDTAQESSATVLSMPTATNWNPRWKRRTTTSESQQKQDIVLFLLGSLSSSENYYTYVYYIWIIIPRIYPPQPRSPCHQEPQRHLRSPTTGLGT